MYHIRHSSPGVSAARRERTPSDPRRGGPNPQLNNAFRHQRKGPTTTGDALSVIHLMKTEQHAWLFWPSMHYLPSHLRRQTTEMPTILRHDADSQSRTSRHLGTSTMPDPLRQDNSSMRCPPIIPGGL